MAQPTQEHLFLHYVDGLLKGSLSWSQVAALVGTASLDPIKPTPVQLPVVEPEPPEWVEPDRVAGAPRIGLGTSDDGFKMVLGDFDEEDFLLQILSDNPDSFRPRGANFPFKGNGLGNVATSEWGGLAIPKGFPETIPGYYRKKFPDAKSRDDYYFIKGNEPDDLFVETAPIEEDEKKTNTAPSITTTVEDLYTRQPKKLIS